ncbi:TPA: hypothetical protein N0F65_006585 [Lagenidium giganteum]|uniref:Uncharacterized protein n=1 Tax=Lagenidium giganteum TaxID=4803 RepID=A0AAV2ZDY4_9STRA|nr:TPA: hypothetical protein N0F65_006585 [Lagenidium giganteum]
MISEFLVLLSLTWFVRLGIELAMSLLSMVKFMRVVSILTSRVRLSLLFIVLVARLGLKMDGVNYYIQGLMKLIVSMVLSVLVGFLAMLIGVRFAGGEVKCFVLGIYRRTSTKATATATTRLFQNPMMVQSVRRGPRAHPCIRAAASFKVWLPSLVHIDVGDFCT